MAKSRKPKYLPPVIHRDFDETDEKLYNAYRSGNELLADNLIAQFGVRAGAELLIMAPEERAGIISLIQGHHSRDFYQSLAIQAANWLNTPREDRKTAHILSWKQFKCIGVKVGIYKLGVTEDRARRAEEKLSDAENTAKTAEQIAEQAKGEREGMRLMICAQLDRLKSNLVNGEISDAVDLIEQLLQGYSQEVEIGAENTALDEIPF